MFGFLNNVETEEEIEYIAAKTFIKCIECNQEFISRNYNKENPTDICKCKNISIGIHPIEHSKYTNFVTVNWEKTPPEIFEEEKEDDRSMEPVETQCC